MLAHVAAPINILIPPVISQGFLQRITKLEQPAPDSGFDSAQRLPQLLRNVGLGQPAKEGQFDRLPLFREERDQSRPNERCSLSALG